MLIAKNEQENLVNMAEMNRAEIEALRNQELVCPACLGRVTIKNGLQKIPHFAHRQKEGCLAFSEGETAEHLGLKLALFEWGSQSGRVMQLEAYLPALVQRPDLLLDMLAIEVQCSPLAQERLRERTENYRNHGYQVIWLCGQKLHLKERIHQLQRHLLYFSPSLGYYFWELDWERSELRLKYHLEELFDGTYHVCQKSWTFGTCDLLTVLTFPKRCLIGSERHYPLLPVLQKYQHHLQRRLYNKDNNILKTQLFLYNRHLHLLYLPLPFLRTFIKTPFAPETGIELRCLLYQLLETNGKQLQMLVPLTNGLLNLAHEERLIQNFSNLDLMTAASCWVAAELQALEDYGYLWRVAGTEPLLANLPRPTSELLVQLKDCKHVSAIPFRSMIR